MQAMKTSFQVKKVATGPEERKSLIAQLKSLQGTRILILGDVGLDEYILGDVRRISPEAPVPVLDVASEESRLGLAANVAQNVVSLGGKVDLVSVVGADEGADKLKKLFISSSVPWDSMVVDQQRPTTRKTRVMAQHHHLVRVDYELRQYLSPETEKKVLAIYAEKLKNCDAVILQDYAKGVISAGLMQKATEMAKRAQKKVFVDPHRQNAAEFYENCDLIKPNYEESLALTGIEFTDLKARPDKVYEVGRLLQQRIKCKDVVLTRGKEGMTIFSGDEIVEVPTFARKVFDVTGAGDTVIAALSLAQASGLSLVEACQIANFAAGVVVGKVGCVPCSIEELTAEISGRA